LLTTIIVSITALVATGTAATIMDPKAVRADTAATEVASTSEVEAFMEAEGFMVVAVEVTAKT
jgi:hypothetical protein